MQVRSRTLGQRSARLVLIHVCPAGTAAALQPLLSRYDWSERRPEVCRRALRDLLCPDLRSCDPHSLLEWLGAVDAGW